MKLLKKNVFQLSIYSKDEYICVPKYRKLSIEKLSSEHQREEVVQLSNNSLGTLEVASY